MFMCLSVSQEIPGLGGQPAPVPMTTSSFKGHRRSASDTVMLKVACRVNHDSSQSTLVDAALKSSRGTTVSSCLPHTMKPQDTTSITFTLSSSNNIDVITPSNNATSPSITVPPPKTNKPQTALDTYLHFYGPPPPNPEPAILLHNDNDILNMLQALPHVEPAFSEPHSTPTPSVTSSSSSTSSSPSSSTPDSAPVSHLNSTLASSSAPTSSPSSSSSRVTCTVCFDDLDPTELVHFNPCKHSFCRECVISHFKVLVFSGQKLSCMSQHCKSVMQEYEAAGAGLMDPTTHERYLMLLRTPAGAHRWCPRPGCDTPFIKADRDLLPSPLVTCRNSACSIAFCYDCRVKWHEDLTCEEFKQELEKGKTEEEILSEKFAAENLQACPNCNIWVEKIDGCEYVMCAACNHEFCWDCLEPHDHNMGAHVHGPNYKPSAPAVYHRRRRGKVALVAKYIAIGVGACVFGPPAVALGAAVGAIALPVLGIQALVKFEKKRRIKKRKAALWRHAQGPIKQN